MLQTCVLRMWLESQLISTLLEFIPVCGVDLVKGKSFMKRCGRLSSRSKR